MKLGVKEIQKTTSIFQKPKALFDMNPEIGLAPLNIETTNNSENALDYSWSDNLFLVAI